jgi:FAD/FMN-containing dehydrogenase
MNQSEVGKLREVVTGEVIMPGADGYDQARGLWNARFDRRPDLVVRCRTAHDVSAAVVFAQQQDLALSIKGGGHAFAANTVADGGLLVDLSSMKGVRIDPQARRAAVGAGLTWGEFTRQTQAYNLAAPGGTVSTVGVAGLTLGGGSGYLSRRHGLTIDSLLGAEVVTAAGQVVRADGQDHPDLFWALRGGGGNFGIVTAFDFRLHELGPEVLAGQIVYSFDQAREVLRHYRDFMYEAPDDVQCYAFILRVPPIPAFPRQYHGQLAVDLVVFHPDPEARGVLAPLLEHGEPIVSAVAPQPYSELLRAFDAGLPAGMRYESRAHDLLTLSDAAIDTCVEQVADLPGAFTMAYLGAGGGAIARRASSDTAYAARDAAYTFHIMAGWEAPAQDGQVLSWVQAFHQAMAPYARDTLYVNLLGTGEEARVQDAYGDNFRRLVELKTRWDPNNLLRMNHNIRPGP